MSWMGCIDHVKWDLRQSFISALRIWVIIPNSPRKFRIASRCVWRIFFPCTSNHFCSSLKKRSPWSICIASCWGKCISTRYVQVELRARNHLASFLIYLEEKVFPPHSNGFLANAALNLLTRRNFPDTGSEICPWQV